MSDEKQQSPEDQGFNDSELQDIMQEIESLEKEFTSDEGGEEEHPSEVSEAEHSDEAKDENKEEKTDLQKAIDKEVEELEMEANMDEMEQALDHAESAPASEQEEHQEHHQEHHEEDDVFNDEDFDEESEAQVTPLPSHSHSHHSKGMQLKASGQMNLELCFPVGDQEAEFKVLPDGFCVELNGIVVHVDEKKGCHISMPGGAEFSLPLEQTKVKKAS